MAEQLALQQVFGQGAAVDRDEGLVGPLRGGMEKASQDLLAGAGLSLDQDVDVLVGDFIGERGQPVHGRRTADLEADGLGDLGPLFAAGSALLSA